MVIYGATFQVQTSGLDLAMKSAGSLSPLQHLMPSSHLLICNSNDWCILVLAIFSEIFLLLLTLLTLVQLCVGWESPKLNI